ncbi:arrestin homolog isoform X2 [Galleria mellonella]|uniref:Arrestin homolog isoform X2 n=1 Tax=Galleria mellonella TaxID=7137 RepID=A0A6J3C8V7_GALME|nr:arrestin homolog isoform X2 [Galleria mellonella]
MTTDNALNSQRVFRKSSPNAKLTMYLASRDLIVENGVIDRIQGVIQVEPDALLDNKKLYGQVTLTFRYGREDEEVMGLKFCNEAIMSLAQIWPIHCNHEREPNTPLQDALIKRLGANTYPFQLELTPLAPPSVQLVPAKQYNGAPIGTSYDVRAFVERADEKVSRRNTVRMGIRVLQGPGRQLPPASLPPNSSHRMFSVLTNHRDESSETPAQILVRDLKSLSAKSMLKNKIKLESDENCCPKKETEYVVPVPPRVTVEKPFILSDGRVELEAWLDKATYYHGESVKCSVVIANHSSKTVRGIKTLVIQHVDVCMFSNGKFKNVVASVKCIGTRVRPGQRLTETFNLLPDRGVTKNWIALEDSYSKTGASLASTVVCSNSPEDRNVFAIYVSYYVKVKCILSKMGGDLSVKLPFILTHSCHSEAPVETVTEDTSPKVILEGKENSDDDSSCNLTVTENRNKDSVVCCQPGKSQEDKCEEKIDNEDTEVKSPEDHRCIADVLVNIENKIERPKVFEGTEVRLAKPDEELDLIVKYHGSDT